MPTEARVHRIPKCDVHPLVDAVYDFKTIHGPWMNGCEQCFQLRSPDGKLGTGKGQRLVLAEKVETD
jgi:hypothetical protein